MEGFTLVDGGALFILAVSAVLAYSRGLVREVMSILGWVIAAAVAFVFAPDVEPLVYEIPLLSDIIQENCVIATLAAFALVFVVALIVVSIFTPLVSGAIQNSALGPLDQGLGFLFGLARGALLILVALIVYERLISGAGGIPMIDDSKTVEVMAEAQLILSEQIPNNAPAWVVERFEQLTSGCNAPVPGAPAPTEN
ncbi:MAG: CvpA family protein [Pseudomonadota bacterium]